MLYSGHAINGGVDHVHFIWKKSRKKWGKSWKNHVCDQKINKKKTKAYGLFRVIYLSHAIDKSGQHLFYEN